MNSFPQSRGVWAWASVGLAGSLLAALAGPASIPDNGWWYAPAAPGGRSVAMAAVFVGAALLAGGWIGLARYARGERTAWLVAIAAVWLTPLSLAPPLFSGDVYSYLAQGTILHLGHNPYNVAPAALAGLHQGHVLSAVSPFWRHTTSPYGPLFLGLMSVVVSITGSHLIAGVLVTRALELVGVGLLAIYVPQLARALGADRARATWLGGLSPLLALELIAGAHQDVLLIRLLVAGVTVALQGRPVQGIAVCALAATVKLPALAGVLFIAVAWARSEPDRSARIRLLAQSALAAVAVVAAVSIVTGLGFSWLTSSVFSTAAQVHLAITPSTAAGWTVAGLLRDAGVAVGHRTVTSAFGVVTLAVTVIAGALLLWRVRVPKVARYLGFLLLIAAACGPAAWPWYFTWGLVLLAACPGLQRSVALAIGVVVGVFLIKPNGILVLPVQSSPAVLAAYVLLAYVAWRSRHRITGARPDRDPDAPAPREAPRAGSVGAHQDLTRA